MSYLKNIALAMAITSGLCVVYTYSAEKKEDAAKRAQQETLDTQLINAIYALDFAGVKQALAQGANAQQVVRGYSDINGQHFSASLIYETCVAPENGPERSEKKDSVRAIITELVKHGVQADFRTLARIIDDYYDDPYPLELLISLGVNINQKDDAGRTLLMIAAFYGNIAALDFLLANGANIEAVDNNGKNIYHYVVNSSPIVSTGLKETIIKHIKQYIEKEIKNAAKQGKTASGNPLMSTVAEYLGTGE